MRTRWLWIAPVVLAVVLVVVTRDREVKESAYKSFLNQAQQYEDSQNWEMARAAWLFARDNADTLYDQRTVDGNPAFYRKVISGAKVYCDYGIAMTYEREGDYEEAIKRLDVVLATPAETINAYLGPNGAEEIAKDLAYVHEVQQKTDSDAIGKTPLPSG